jgi:lysophospholipid acyltransferase (LPLAT)-like uncharacterized protein
MVRRERPQGSGGRALRFAARVVAAPLIALLGRSIRTGLYHDRFVQERARRGEACIYSFWHNRLLLMPNLYRRIRGTKRLCALVSRSRDGQYISEVLKGFGIAAVRGSTSKGGEVAILEMVDRLHAGDDAAVTPDGPRGPCYRVQPGVILIAQMSGLPIVPVSGDVSRKKRLKNWDRFIVPLPFARGALVFGDPIWVPRDLDPEGREKLRAALEGTMREVDRKAAAAVGAQPD